MPYQCCSTTPTLPVETALLSECGHSRPPAAQTRVYVGSLGNHRWLSLSVIINGLSSRHRNVFHSSTELLLPQSEPVAQQNTTPSFNPITAACRNSIHHCHTYLWKEMSMSSPILSVYITRVYCYHITPHQLTAKRERRRKEFVCRCDVLC